MPTALVNGLSMYYELHGDGSPLVLIGGLGADLTLLTPLTDDLSLRHRVVTFDNRGAGRSGQPDEPYSIPLMAADTLGLMDALSIERADLLGLSMGGRVALEVALTHPDRVRRLVLVSTSARGRGRIRMSVPMRLMWLLQWLPILQGRYPQSRSAHRRQRQAALAYDATSRLAAIAAPTLILHGRRDRSIPVELARELHAGIPGSHLELFRGGHMVALLSQRSDVVAHVEDFLAG